MPRSRRGSGSVFQRTYRDSKGKLHKTKNWYIEFVAGNRTMREATEFTNRTDAAEFLKKRISDALGGKIVLSREPAGFVDGIVEAMDLTPDLVICAGNALLDALALVTASHLNQQYLSSERSCQSPP